MPALLDVAIGTIFTFLLLSLVVSALNEVILSKFDQRAKFLQMGLQELFGEATGAVSFEWRKNWKTRLSGGLLSRIQLTGMTQELCQHGLINAFSRTDKPGLSAPSYIPAGSFVTALLSIISRQSHRVPTSSIDSALTPNQKNWWQRFLSRVGQQLQSAAGDAAAVQNDTNARLAEVSAALRSAVAGLPGEYKKLQDSLGQKLDAAVKDPTQLKAIADELRNGLLAPGGLEHTSANIEQWINAIPQPKLRESLQSLFLVAEKDVEKFKAAVEGWFNATMDRVSGWYKRFTQKWMIVLAFLLAAILNVDTIHIVRELSVTPNLAKAVASQAQNYSRNHERPMSESEAHEAARLETEKASAALNAAKESGDPIQLQHASADLARARSAEEAEVKFHAAVTKLAGTGIPIGWDDAQRRSIGLDRVHLTLGRLWRGLTQPKRWGARLDQIETWFSTYFPALIELMAGWGLSALAASLGAPFWFDTLSRFVNLRNAGRPPGEMDPTSKATKPPPASLDKTPGLPTTTAR